MKQDPVYIKLDWSDANQLEDLLNRLNAMHKRAIQRFEIAPAYVTIEERFDIYEEEGFALAKTLDQLSQQV